MSRTTDCELVKQGRVPITDFEGFLEHVAGCGDCQRRIAAQIVTNFRQRQTERE